MILVDILCLYSCVHIILFPRIYKKVYYILKSGSWLDRLIINLLQYFGWEFIPLDYEFKSTNLDSSFIDVQKDLANTVKKHIRPVIERQINSCAFFSEYEKKRISTYIESVETKDLYRSIEILHILKLLKDKIDTPKVILLHCSRWKDVLSAKYRQQGYKIKFYRIYVPFKLQIREKYFRDILARSAIKRRPLFNICLFFYKVTSNIFYSAYFYILNKVQRNIPAEIEKFDICAFIPGYSGSKWLNDFHWKKTNSRNKYRTLAILYGRLDETIYSNFRHLAERWISLNKLNFPPNIFSIYYWLWPAYPKNLARTLIHLFGNILSSDIFWDYKLRIINLLTEVSKFEALFKIIGVKVFWSSVQWDHFESLAGTIAINRVGGVSLGSIWSVYGFPSLATQRNINDIFFVWGERHVRIFLEGGIVFKSMIIAGYPVDYCLKDYLSKATVLRKTWKRQSGGKKILCFYDNLITKDYGSSFSDSVDYLKNLLHWIKKEPETFLVIKSKEVKTFETYPASVIELLRTLEEEKRLTYEFERGDLAPGLASELVLGLGAATLSHLLGTYGKNVILLDCDRYYEKWPIIVPNIKFIKKPQDIVKSLDTWMAQVREETVKKHKIEIEPMPSQLDDFADGKSVERITEYISSLLTDLQNGLSSDIAIHNANMHYRNRWNSEKVITYDGTI